MDGTFERIYAAVKAIPAGRVASYGQIARLCGMPRAARVVGYAMASCRDETVPCHRVVDAKGGTKKAFDTWLPDTQRMRLEAEGVGFLLDGRVDMAEYQWDR
ncbi:MAG: MGMT family protein [Clostridia bacterium]|nr:MGMT family protein [Clostridia bacterium]